MLNWLYVLPRGGEANRAWRVFRRARVFVSAGTAASTVVCAGEDFREMLKLAGGSSFQHYAPRRGRLRRRPAKYWAACRARTRQALCKANAASQRLVLVSGRLVSLALFIVSATRHLLEMRLCPLCPRSTAQRELVNIFEVFARTWVRGGCSLR